MCGVNNQSSINILDRVESLISKIYNIHWIRGLQARIHTIMDEWCVNDNSFTILNYWSQQWYQYQHSWPSGVTNDSKFYNIHRLEDYSHEYLRLWMSGFFNDQRFTILNKWSQHWSMYQSFLQSGVNNNSKLYNMYWVRGLHARISTIMNEWCLQWPKVYNFE